MQQSQANVFQHVQRGTKRHCKSRHTEMLCHYSLSGGARGQHWFSAWLLDLQLQRWSPSFCWSTGLSVQASSSSKGHRPSRNMSHFLLWIVHLWNGTVLHMCLVWPLQWWSALEIQPIAYCDVTAVNKSKRLPMHRSGASSSLLEHLASLWRLAFSFWHLHGRST